MLVIPITRGLSSPARKCLLPWLQELLSTDRTLLSACGVAQHGSIPPLGQWGWIQGRRTRCDSHAEMLCIGWKLLSLCAFSTVTKSLFHLSQKCREGTSYIQGKQTKC